MSWAAQEFVGLNLGDKRLNTRLVKLAEAFAREPTASIPGACGGRERKESTASSPRNWIGRTF